MPVAVMAESAFSFKKLLDQCENQELEAPGGIATPPVYGQLLALYLLHNDMNNARYLWKRIPPAIKSANSELGGIWSVGQRIWQRDFPGIYTTINAHQWSETVQPIMEALRDATRRRAFALVSQAYTSIIADDFAAFVGLPVEEAVKGILEQGWQADSTTRMVLPRKPAGTTGTCHHTRLIFVFLVEIGFHHVGQASLELLTSSDLPSSTSQSAGITGVSHRTRPISLPFMEPFVTKIVLNIQTV
ncbi:COP9 signalosome complex subunit 8, partial [Plecturocebus cupreus]